MKDGVISFHSFTEYNDSLNNTKKIIYENPYFKKYFDNLQINKQTLFLQIVSITIFTNSILDINSGFTPLLNIILFTLIVNKELTGINSIDKKFAMYSDLKNYANILFQFFSSQFYILYYHHRICNRNYLDLQVNIVILKTYLIIVFGPINLRLSYKREK
ncbi:hypothetical protein BpHYR1_009000 [Brachionus plicatilis]|uniref:Uncharacterized protein n=1 Tax=Brachionus plicatilis TaxID=10195 RepID=A0A3M7QDF1_BRAPC|nr:hypothetical protein BpHYR1_009000 [Brachionus plicatilis]